jgi:hypothetical protein
MQKEQYFWKGAWAKFEDVYNALTDNLLLLQLKGIVAEEIAFCFIAMGDQPFAKEWFEKARTDHQAFCMLEPEPLTFAEKIAKITDFNKVLSEPHRIGGKPSVIRGGIAQLFVGWASIGAAAISSAAPVIVFVGGTAAVLGAFLNEARASFF